MGKEELSGVQDSGGNTGDVVGRIEKLSTTKYEYDETYLDHVTRENIRVKCPHCGWTHGITVTVDKD